MGVAVRRPAGAEDAARTAAPASAVWSLQIPVRTGGPAFILSGILMAVATAGNHPSIFEGDVGHAVHGESSWVAIHLLIAAATVAGWWGMVTAVTLHRARLGRAADAILVAATVGAFALAAVMVVEAVAFPVLAVHAPATLELDGPVFGSLGLRAVSVLSGGYLAAFGALGLLSYRAGVWRPASAALLGSGVAFAALAGPFVPVLGLLASWAVSAVLVWWGVLVGRASPVDAR